MVTYLIAFEEGGELEELEYFGDKGSELLVRVRVLHAQSYLRVGFNQGCSQFLQVLECVWVVLKLGILNTDLCRLF